MSTSQRVRGGAPGVGPAVAHGPAAPAARARLQPLQRTPMVNGSNSGAPSPAARGALLVTRAAAAGGALWSDQSEWEMYRAENDWQSRTLGLMQRLAMNWRQEWEVYHNEWTAQARLVEGIAGGAKAAQAAAAAQQLTKAAVKAAVALEAELGDDLCPGGYHPVKVGEQYKEGRYTALHPLGAGHYSTVWMAHDRKTGQRVAMKIVRSAENYTAAAAREVSLLVPIAEQDPTGEASNCVRLLDAFEHEGPHGMHVVEVFEAMGDDLLALIRAYNHDGVPMHIVRHLIRQTLVALDFLHSKCNIIHTDLKPENVVLTETLRPREAVLGKARADLPPFDLDDLEPRLLRMGCKVVDFGNACWNDQHFSEDIQTRPYRAPEVILGSGYDNSSDIWSLGCMVFELITGQCMFNLAEVEPKQKDAEHVAQMMERLGNMPTHMISGGTFAHNFYEPDGSLRRRELAPISIERLLMDKHGLHADEAAGLRDFLLPMLELDPSKRATAAELLQHPWLRGELPMVRLLNNISNAGTLAGRAPRVKWGSPRSPTQAARQSTAARQSSAMRQGSATRQGSAIRSPSPTPPPAW